VEYGPSSVVNGDLCRCFVYMYLYKLEVNNLSDVDNNKLFSFSAGGVFLGSVLVVRCESEKWDTKYLL